jgi:general stress protein CsbA
MILFAEGGHFSLLPTVIKALYSNMATQIYSLLFTFTGLSNLLMIIVVKSSLGHDYQSMFWIMSGLSGISLVILLTVFEEKIPTKSVKTTDYFKANAYFHEV